MTVPVVIPAWHPIVVHFPLALVPSAAIGLLAARILGARPLAGTLALVGTWNLGVGALGVLAALGTGLAAAIDVHVAGAAHQAISAHVKSAIVSALLVLLAALWRVFGVAAAARPSRGFLVVLWVATASLVVTGYRGGQNVYHYGIGVERVGPAETPR